MHESYKNGDFDRVPIMIGFTSEEILTFIFSEYRIFKQFVFAI